MVIMVILRQKRHSSQADRKTSIPLEHALLIFLK